MQQNFVIEKRFLPQRLQKFQESNGTSCLSNAEEKAEMIQLRSGVDDAVNIISLTYNKRLLDPCSGRK